MSTEEDARVLLAIGMRLWNSVLHGCNAGSRIKLFERMSHPEPGDLVYERSSSFMLPPQFPDYPALNKVGHLISIAREPLPNWVEYDEDDPNPGERVIYIRTLDGRTYRWTNADVVAIHWESTASTNSSATTSTNSPSIV